MGSTLIYSSAETNLVHLQVVGLTLKWEKSIIIACHDAPNAITPKIY